MKKIVRLTENDLTRIVRKVIKEQDQPKSEKGEIINNPNITNKTVTLYADESQKQRIIRATITEVADAQDADGVHLDFDIDGDSMSSGLYICGSGDIMLFYKDGNNSNVYNKQLTDLLMKEFCTSDFAQNSGGDTSDFA